MKKITAAKTLYIAILVTAISWSVFYGISFTSIYSTEHIYKQASRWIYRNIEKGAKIASGDWDDTLPVHLPGENPRRYKFGSKEWIMPLYEADSRGKLQRVVKQLERADYIIFPTQRHVGSILRIPDEYPYTDALLRLLYVEKLGFSLIRTFKEYPRFLDIRFNDDLADESLSVYDHPKVTIFKKVKDFTAEELLNRIQNIDRFEPLPTNNEIMLSEKQGPHAERAALPAMLQVFLWFLVIELLGLISLAFLILIFKGSESFSVLLYKPLSLILFPLLLWLFAVNLSLPLTVSVIWTILLLLLAVATGVLCLNYRKIYQTLSRELFWIEGLFLLGALVMLGFRAFRPEIFWGEKPMDFSFYNFLIRSESLPAQDPWAAGNIMNYYYFGTFIFAIFHKLFPIDAGIGYNLALATLPAISLCALYALLRVVRCSRLFALLCAIFVALSSNPEILNLAFFSGKEWNFDLFWASSRVLSAHGINEYPIWSFIFGDLHAHLIAQPFTVLLVALSVALLMLSKKLSGISRRLQLSLIGAVWGSLFIINTWDFISYALLLLFFGLFYQLRKGALLFKSEGVPLIKGFLIFIRELLVDVLYLIIPALLVALPLLEKLLAAEGGSGFGWVSENEFNTFFQIFRHFGFWLFVFILAAPFILLDFLKSLKRESFSWSVKLSVLAFLFCSVPIGLAIGSLANSPKELPLDIVLLTEVLLLLGTFQIFSVREDDYKGALAFDYKRLSGVMMIAGALLLIFSELCFLQDRMNTLFKLFNAIWYLWGIAAVLNLFYLVKRSSEKGFLSYLAKAATVLCFLSLILALAGTVIAGSIMTSFQRTPGPRPTLDGTAYLNYKDPTEASLVKWINRNIKGTPVILEAHGRSYAEFTRISMFTGLPTVLGWEHHVYQRGTSRSDISQRKRDIARIYNAADGRSIVPLLRRYAVSYIVVGAIEMRTYSLSGLKKFSIDTTLFKPLFKDGDTTLYKVQGVFVSESAQDSASASESK